MTTIVLAAFIDGERLLMARRADHKANYPGNWDLPGGHVEAGERIAAALAREAEEEVGLTPTSFPNLGSFNDSNTGVAYELFRVTAWVNGPPRLLGDEHSVCVGSSE